MEAFISSRRCAVLHIINSLDMGGAEVSLHRLLSRLHTSETPHAVLALALGGSLSKDFAELGVEVLQLDVRRNPIASYRMLKNFIADLNPEVLQGWLYHGNIVAWWAGRFTHRRVYWNIRHSLDDLGHDRIRTRALIRTEALLSRTVNGTVFNSRTSRTQHVRRGFYERNAIIIPNGYDTQQLRRRAELRRTVRESLGISDSAFVIGHVARYHAVKGHALLMDAAVQVSEQLPDALFVMAGRGVAPSNAVLAGKISRNGCHNVRLVGERQDISELMAAFDVLCSSSLAESFPNVVAEAMACEVPCVATRVGDTDTIVGESGVIVKAGDASALATGIMRLARLRHDDRRRLGALARQRIVQDYSLDSTARSYSELYAV